VGGGFVAIALRATQAELADSVAQETTEAQRAQRMRKMGTELGELTHQGIEIAMEVHRILGSELLESIYEEALCWSFRSARFPSGVKWW
jgi:hypothetical protein